MSEKVLNRNRTVLDAGLALAERHGLQAVTRPRVAAESGLSVGTVSNAFGTMDGLRDAVVAAVVETCDSSPVRLPVLAQALAERHPVALAAPPELKQRALANLAA
jgi:AcrR family transcriptional regulator